MGDLFHTQRQELEDLAFGWVVDQILAAFAARLQTDREITESPIEDLFARFCARVASSLRQRIIRTASTELLKAS